MILAVLRNAEELLSDRRAGAAEKRDKTPLLDAGVPAARGKFDHLEIK
jgi:hypothetical protein